MFCERARIDLHSCKKQGEIAPFGDIQESATFKRFCSNIVTNYGAINEYTLFSMYSAAIDILSFLRTRLNTFRHCPLFVGLVIFLFSAGCDSLNPDDLVDLDFRGEWLLIAQHQAEPELSIRYTFLLTENVDHTITASALQYILDIPLWDSPIEVAGRIQYGDDTLRLEFNFPNTGLGPEIVMATFSRVRVDLSVVAVSAEHYSGKAVGLLIPRGGVIPYETDILTMEQIR